MAYHTLTNETGGSPDSRRAEADKLVRLIGEHQSELTEREADFVVQMDEGGPVSPKQLFWLRDIKDKYL